LARAHSYFRLFQESGDTNMALALSAEAAVLDPISDSVVTN
jgi:hypothetical protein